MALGGLFVEEVFDGVVDVVELDVVFCM